ncbi:22046_t:CDS:2, partial [Cetraspora pellucida]
ENGYNSFQQHFRITHVIFYVIVSHLETHSAFISNAINVIPVWKQIVVVLCICVSDEVYWFDNFSEVETRSRTLEEVEEVFGSTVTDLNNNKIFQLWLVVNNSCSSTAMEPNKYKFSQS